METSSTRERPLACQHLASYATCMLAQPWDVLLVYLYLSLRVAKMFNLLTWLCARTRFNSTECETCFLFNCATRKQTCMIHDWACSLSYLSSFTLYVSQNARSESEYNSGFVGCYTASSLRKNSMWIYAHLRCTCKRNQASTAGHNLMPAAQNER